MRNENNETLEKHPSDAELPIWVVDLFGGFIYFAGKKRNNSEKQ
jgi:hypothetical protein